MKPQEIELLRSKGLVTDEEALRLLTAWSHAEAVDRARREAGKWYAVGDGAIILAGVLAFGAWVASGWLASVAVLVVGWKIATWCGAKQVEAESRAIRLDHNPRADE